MTITQVDPSSGTLLLKQEKMLQQVDTFSLVCVYNMSDIHIASFKLLEVFARSKGFEAHAAPEARHNTFKEQIAHTFSAIDK